jgi:hypothetical protein
VKGELKYENNQLDARSSFSVFWRSIRL